MIPQIEATIAQATPLNNASIPFAAIFEDSSMAPAPLPISVLMALESSRSQRPIITPAIVPAKPQYKGIGVWVAMSFSTESQCRSTASFNRPKSMTDPELLPKYLLIESLIESKMELPVP